MRKAWETHIMEIGIREQIETFKRQKLDEALAKVTDDQRALFNRIFPEGVPEDKLIQAIELCERTIARNIKVAADDGSE